MNLISLAKDQVTSKMINLISELFAAKLDEESFKFEIPPDPKMGHLAFACFPLAKALRKAPPIIAKELAEKFKQNEWFERVIALGPYINFSFSGPFLAGKLFQEAIKPEFGNNNHGKGFSVMLEYSSPNTNKPLHLGHGRNNLLGMALAKIIECNGHKVIKANLVNDRGIHICKSMLAYQKWGEGVTPESRGKKGDKLVGEFYVLYDQKSKEIDTLEEEAKAMLLAWEQGEPEVLKLWKDMNSWVLDGFKKTYERMGAEFDQYYFESETYQGGKEIILKALEDGICQEEDNGAISIDLEKEKLGKKILLRGDGTSMYITQDINTTITKFKDYPLEACYFVVGNEQDNHFRVLFKTLEKFGYDWAKNCEHISYGMITLPEGKMKSREGTVVDLDDLMTELKNLALAELKERENFDQKKDQELIEFTAEAIGQAALKFFILRSGAIKEIQFNPKESLSFEGATGPYLQYTHARIASLLKNAKTQEIAWDLNATVEATTETETLLLTQLARFADAIELAAKDKNPAVICNYAYDLCKGYNKFYYDQPILKVKGPERAFRLALSKAVQSVLAKSLNLLGITALNKM